MNLRKHLDHLFVVTAMLLMSSAFISHIVDLSTAESSSAGSAQMQLIWLAIYVVTLLRVAPHWRETIGVMRANLTFCIFASLAVVSMLWSADPLISLRHSMAFVFCTLFGIDLARRYTLRQQLGLIGATLWIAILFSCFVQLVAPNFVLPATFGESNIVDNGAWIGIFHQKNIFGHVLAVAGVLTVSQITFNRKTLLLAVVSLGICFAVIGKVESETALVAICATAFLLFSLLILRLRRRALSTLGSGIGLIASSLLVAALLNRDLLASLVGRTSNLTGRTDVWALVFESIARRPLLGYGFGAFWQTSYDSHRIDALLGWTVPSSHNVYIDIVVQLGFAGLGLFCVAYGTAFVRAISAMRGSQDPAARWPLAYILLATIYGFSESDLFAASSLYWVLFTAACITATRYAPVREPKRVTVRRVLALTANPQPNCR
jgi:exopolysaccharide production protein ExoQ